MEYLFLTPFLLFAVTGASFWAWMVSDCANEDQSTGKDKLVWLLFILVAGVFGATIYYFTRRRKRIANALIESQRAVLGISPQGPA